jgi:autotransporter-associated beta strand protein
MQPPSTITGTGSVYYNVAYIGVGNVNTYSGGTTIAGGEVEAYESTSFGTGPVVVNGGFIASNYGHDFPNTFNLSGAAITTGNYTGQGNAAGYSELGGATVLAADTTINEGGGSGLIFGSTVTAPNNNNLILNAGGNGVVFDGSVSLGTGQIENSTTVQLNPASGTAITISSVISGSGSVSHIGSGTTVLTAVNTYTGGTTVSAGLLKFAVPGAFPVDSPLTITGGTAQAASSTSTATKNTLFASSLAISGTGLLDLTNNDLLVQSDGGATTLSGITALIAKGYNYGHWNGTSGITSSAAAANTTHLTALGVIVNDNGSGSQVYSQFDGQSTSDGDVLVKYTYYGDANLDGKVDGSDYSLIDAGYASGGTLTGWQNGDFNYDGVIDGSDYALIDNAFNNQGTGFGASASALTAASTAQVAATAVPEPASLGLAALATSALTVRRRRQPKVMMTA